MTTLLDKFKGCILGSAVGDALGMAVERLTRKEIKETYGTVDRYLPPDPRTFKQLHRLKPGQYTDDTVLGIELAESIINNKGVVLTDIAYRHVKAFQAEPPRGWGRATTSAVERLLQGIPLTESGHPDSTGNGGAMKIAPLGLWYALRNDHAALQGAAEDIAHITHQNRDAKNAAGLQARLVRMLAREDATDGDIFLKHATAIASEYDDDDRKSPLAENVYTAWLLRNNRVPPSKALAMLGTSGNVLESLPAALYIFSRAPDDFEKTVVAAASAGRDTDTVAAMAGALSGALNGVDAIPKRFLDGLEQRDYLERLAERLYDATTLQP